MKKLTLALLSLMLFLGMGTAFAQTLPTPAFTPASGETVAPGKVINFTIPDEVLDGPYLGVIIMYTEDASATLEATSAELMAAAQADAGFGIMADGDGGASPRLWKAAMYDVENEVWWSMVSVSAEATGTVTLRMRLAAPPYSGDVLYSDEMTATYTIASGEVARPDAPTFSPAGGAVPAGTPIQILGGMPAAFQIPYYVVNGSDADFNLTFEQWSALPENAALKPYYTAEDDAPTVNEAMTLKAAIAQLNVGEQTLVWSEITTATYTVADETPVVKPAAPVFNPNGGTVTLDQPISLTAASADADALIFYTMDMEYIPDFSEFETEEELEDALDMFMMYEEAFTFEVFGITAEDLAEGDAEMPLKAAVAVINDGNITWSATTTATFTITGGEEPEPGITVEKPVITPGNDNVIALNQKVQIECATEGAEIYYTTDGQAPYTADDNGDPAGIADYAIKYTAPFLLPEGTKVGASVRIRAIAVKDGILSDAVSAGLVVEAAVVVAAPTFDPEAGEVAFGTALVLVADADATIYYTTDGTTPTEESEEFLSWDEIMIYKSMTVKAIAVVDGIASEVATAAYTVAPVENATLTLEPMKEDTVGKNVGTGVSFTDGTAKSESWIQDLPASVYYTTDGTTVPSKEAYEAQADKENGAIKMVAVKWEEQWGSYGPVQDGEGNLLSLTFTEATHLKAIGYLMDGDEVLITTALLDTMLNIKAEANPTFSLADYSKVAEGDKLVIENPNYYDEFDMEMPAWPEDYFDNEESAKAYDEAMDAYDEAYAAYAEEIAQLPQTELYFSFDGTKPTRNARYADENESVFSTREGGNIEITFGKDETGYYAYIPEVRGYNSPADTVRLGEDGLLSVQVLCVTTETATEEGGDPMPLSAKWGRPGGAAPFVYGSDFTVATYAVKDILIATPAFSVAAGEVEEGTKVEIACETEGAVIYYTVDGAEPTAESIEYKEAIEINEAMTVKAIAIKGDFKSEVATAAYTVKETANEDEELAGVSVYPNPSNGVFNIELPVAATIEVFASNGVLTQRVNAAAGNATLNINRSGIYFLRITGEGRTAIKRIIVH